MLPPYERQIGWLPNDPQYLVLPPSNADTQVSPLLYLFFQENETTHIPSVDLLNLTMMILSPCRQWKVNRRQYCR